MENEKLRASAEKKSQTDKDGHRETKISSSVRPLTLNSPHLITIYNIHTNIYRFENFGYLASSDAISLIRTFCVPFFFFFSNFLTELVNLCSIHYTHWVGTCLLGMTPHTHTFGGR